MKYKVLGVGYLPNEYEAERAEWMEHGMTFDFADSIHQAAEMLREQDYVCIAIRSAQITHEDLLVLREVCPIPTIILPPAYTAAEGRICAYFSAMQFARVSGHGNISDSNGEDSLKRVLDIQSTQRDPLTIITVKDLSFCLEYRSVEIRGMEVELTEKEFDILALLLTNPKKVFTHEMIMDAVWHEDSSFYSTKAVTTHISNLRRKLKTAPDVPEYIKSVRGVGYKFDIPK